MGKNPCFLFYPADWDRDMGYHPLDKPVIRHILGVRTESAVHGKSIKNQSRGGPLALPCLPGMDTPLSWGCR